jgi:hypothetical protein
MSALFDILITLWLLQNMADQKINFLSLSQKLTVKNSFGFSFETFRFCKEKMSLQKIDTKKN